MASPHQPVARALRLPSTFRHVRDYLALHDSELRIRRSVEQPGMFILERRCRRRPPVHTGRRDASDIHVQARDGYIHVATVHPSYLTRPWNMIRALQKAHLSYEDLALPGQMHGIRGDGQIHYYRRMTEFFDRELGGGTSGN